MCDTAYGAGGGNPSGHSNTAENAYQNSDALLEINHIARYTSGAEFDESGTEIVKYNYKNGYGYSVNGAESSLDIIDVAGQNNGEINLVKRIYLEDHGIEAGDLTSVTVHPKGKYVAVSAPAEDKTEKGKVVFLDAEGNLLNSLSVGSLPDMLTFTPDGEKLLVANEGEPSDDYQINPEGSISIVDITGNPKTLTAESVSALPFTKNMAPEDLRTVGPDAEKDYLNMEPEFISIDSDSKYAYATLQESNAVAKIDIQNKKIVEISSLGYKDHSVERNSMDISDQDGKNEMMTAPVLGLYQPDGIAAFEKNGETYILTANEGDAQDYEGYSEEARAGEIEGRVDLNAANFAGYSQKELDDMAEDGLFNDGNAGRLNITEQHSFKDGDIHNALVSFGGRSFSILKGSDLSQLYDSGNEFENIIQDEVPERFNIDFAGPDEYIQDDRSDNKGPEPESVETGKVGGKTYAFIGLERTGGIMIYDVTEPTAPEYAEYIYDETNTDISPEGIEFINPQDSPDGKARLMVANELSGTISTYSLQ
ncbi:hypothetical protein AAT16_10035 [Salinicoccus halodurans]|uniref:Choice-of-anchor I domain-containing protein n=1 Tax=Salinicoccus halodurans TaxID=407035 RepID=A0ABM5TBV8_9STAP|nr:hypothetical protein AAT16_10035 [Salinicoccus halodurans]